MADPFPIAEQLVDAPNHRRRAEILLTLSDAALLPYSGELQHACRMAGFPIGSGFVRARTVALAATRDAHGLLPVHVVLPLEEYRVALSRVAAGEGGT